MGQAMLSSKNFSRNTSDIGICMKSKILQNRAHDAATEIQACIHVKLPSKLVSRKRSVRAVIILQKHVRMKLRALTRRRALASIVIQSCVRVKLAQKQFRRKKRWWQ